MQDYYCYIYTKNYANDDYALDPEEREEIICLHAKDGNICCIEEHLNNDEV